MTIGLLFWILMILWLVFGLYWNRGLIRSGEFGLIGGNLLSSITACIAWNDQI